MATREPSDPLGEDDSTAADAGSLPEPGRVAALWAGEPDGPDAAICPYLVRVDAALLAWIAESLAADPWGMFVVAPHPAGDPAGDPAGTTARVARALRRLLRVRTPDGSVVYFRWYDPQVLPDVLRVSTDAELAVMIGGGTEAVQAFAVTDAGGLDVTVYDRRAAPAPLPRSFMVSMYTAPEYATPAPS